MASKRYVLFSKSRNDLEFEETDFSVSTKNDIELWIMDNKAKRGLDWRVKNMVKFLNSDTIYEFRKNVAVREKDLLNKELEVFNSLVYVYIDQNEIEKAQTAIRTAKLLGYKIGDINKYFTKIKKIKEELGQEEYQNIIEESHKKIQFAERK